jgi:hypothetical protein
MVISAYDQAQRTRVPSASTTEGIDEKKRKCAHEIKKKPNPKYVKPRDAGRAK